MLSEIPQSFEILQALVKNSVTAESTHVNPPVSLNAREAQVFSVVRSALLAYKPEYFEHIKKLATEYPRTLILKDENGDYLLKNAYKNGHQDLEEYFTKDILGKRITGSALNEILEDFNALKVKDIEVLVLQQKEAEAFAAKQQKEFAAGTILGKIALHPGLEYLDDSIAGNTQGKALQDYYYEQFSLSSLLQEGAYYGVSAVLSFVPNPVKFTNNPTYNKALAGSIVMGSKIALDIATNQFEMSLKYAGNLASFVMDSLASYGALIAAQQIGLYAKSPLAIGAVVSVIPDVRKITFHSIDKLLESPQLMEASEPAEQPELKPVKYNPYQKLAIKFHVSEGYVAKFYNQHQIAAYKILKNAAEAVQITNIYQIKALENGIEFDTAKYFGQIQYIALEAYNLLPEDAAQITNSCQLEALKKGESFEEAVVEICGDVGEF